MIRPDGYYWIKFHGPDYGYLWLIGYWVNNDNGFYLAGETESRLENVLEVDERKIINPNE